MFLCVECNVSHLSSGDRAKANPSICRVCAYGLTNRRQRRRAPASQICALTKCWKESKK